ncbi:MAG: adenosylcobinamide-GDP ribazoletransferase [Methylophilaceae bacterium]|jgi:adenosylcobinamide-GDP ribazoletransferase|nr:adenosylcobinamide-GDP ribazoletransferase [Methylophilaceae bacterium]
MQCLIRQWRLLKTALVFFTRVPLMLPDYDEADLARSTRYFPLVGLLVGAFGALVFWLGDFLLPLELAVLLSMVATLLLTGAFHEDGLSDAVDGLGGGWEKEQVLTIMTDSRVGSYGAIAIVLALLIKFQALSHLSAAMIPLALVAGHALSRFCATLVIATQSYVKPEGKAKPLATQITPGELLVAAVFGLFPLVLLDIRLLSALVPVTLVWFWFSAKIRSRIGGYTGDCLGAMQQLTEVAFYLGLLASIALTF